MHQRIVPERGKTCILVLGMRSGTSALARCLSLLGAGLPAHLLPGNHSNETGHWEPEEIVSFSDRLLGRLGVQWDTLRDPDFSSLPASERAAFRDELATILTREYGDAPLIVLKEPRIGRLFAFYAEALEAAGYELRVILTRRDPLGVAQSFTNRDGDALGYTLLLWISYALGVEHATRGFVRTFLSYDDLMVDPERVLRHAEEDLGISYPRPVSGAIDEIRPYLSGELYHNHPGAGDVPIFAADVHRTLGNLASHDVVGPVTHLLDQQREHVARIVDALDPASIRHLSLAGFADVAQSTARDDGPPARTTVPGPSEDAALPRAAVR